MDPLLQHSVATLVLVGVAMIGITCAVAATFYVGGIYVGCDKIYIC
jgi:hypothetical protein